ncbi:interleukin-8-like [Acipenser ruthenus]|uniref:interleukin-8-like n=1 Tax=Acipenser ruthenus TaxID=7906 RepID=UPI0027423198|nr:interleukin-8-like [Acipenser ruthenus]
MNSKTTVAVVIFCLAVVALSEGMSLKSIGLELRCQCIKKESRFIHPRQIRNVELFPSGPHCKDAEIIATLKSGDQICLEPTARWVKIVIKKILESSKA